jgi:4-amino-4-deoxy-L-arabinose transferase-like glycosyltransferase
MHVFRKHSGAIFVSIGFLLRLGSVAYQYRYHLNPALDHWRFGWEMGRVARALYEGHGFASPIYQPSGPTAWVAPVYPLLIATGFKLFGLYTAASAWFILALNALFGALTALPVRAIARRLFGPRTANISAWVWTLLPYSIYLAGERIWENTLTTLLAACLLWATYVVNDSEANDNSRAANYRPWLLWAALWAFAGLTSPSLLAPLPFLGLWLAIRHRRAHRPWFLQSTAAALLFFALISPWTLRNYQQFHRFIPMRDNFWLEVHVGNNGDDRLPCPDAVHPSNSAIERQQWASLGELAYMDAKKIEANVWLRNHPREFLTLTARRTLFVWTGFWSLTPYYLSAEPMEFLATAYFTIITLLAGAGFFRAFRNGFASLLWPMLWFLLIFPAPYYVTHPSYDYRHAMDPILIIMATYACMDWSVRPSSKRDTTKMELSRNEVSS